MPIPPAPECEHPGPLRTPPVNDAALDRAARIFRALGDVPRLRILAVLAQGSACVTELAEAAQENLSTVSQRLRVLRSEDIVVRRRRGKHIDYSLADQHMMDLIFNALAHASETRPVSPASRPHPEENDNASNP